MTRIQKSPRRGVFLIELLAYLPIMAAVLLLVTEMFVMSMRMFKETRDRDTLLYRVDIALDTLRRDVWCAASIQTQGNEVTLTQKDGVVRWRMEADGKLIRIAPAAEPSKKTWIGMPTFSFTAGGATLKLDVESRPGGKHEETTLVSARILAGGGK